MRTILPRSRCLAVAALLALSLTACGSSTDDDTHEGVTIKHGQGTVTIPRKPQRVVALGSADVQIATALGAHVVGAVKNDYSSDGQWLGVDPPLGKDVKMFSYTEPDLEGIAALKPDLILITSAQPSFAQQYDKLSKIAPTISYRKRVLEDSGDELVSMIAKATWRTAEAKKLTTDAHRAAQAWRKKHPELDGKKVAFGQFAGGKTYIVVSPTAPSTVFYRDLGFTVPKQLAALPVQAPPGIHTIPDEKLDLLDHADYVVLGVGSAADRKALLSNPVVKNLDITKAGHIKFVDFNVATALLAPSPATAPTILDELDKVLEN